MLMMFFSLSYFLRCGLFILSQQATDGGEGCFVSLLREHIKSTWRIGWGVLRVLVGYDEMPT